MAHVASDIHEIIINVLRESAKPMTAAELYEAIPEVETKSILISHLQTIQRARPGLIDKRLMDENSGSSVYAYHLAQKITSDGSLAQDLMAAIAAQRNAQRFNRMAEESADATPQTNEVKRPNRTPVFVVTQNQTRVLHWLAQHKSSSPAQAIAYLCGFSLQYHDTRAPQSADEMRDCLQLFDDLPFLEEHFEEMSSLNPAWQRLVARWREATSIMYEDFGMALDRINASTFRINGLLRECGYGGQG